MANAGAEFKFDASEWEKTLKSLRKKWKDIETRKKFGSLISIKVFQDLIDHFEQEEGPNGKWEKWSDIYADHMQKIGKGGNKILQDTGRLRMSITPSGGTWKANADGVLFISKVPYARVHDQGSKRMPQRQFMWLSDKAMAEIQKMTLDFLTEET